MLADNVVELVAVETRLVEWQPSTTGRESQLRPRGGGCGGPRIAPGVGGERRRGLVDDDVRAQAVDLERRADVGNQLEQLVVNQHPRQETACGPAPPFPGAPRR